MSILIKALHLGDTFVFSYLFVEDTQIHAESSQIFLCQRFLCKNFACFSYLGDGTCFVEEKGIPIPNCWQAMMKVKLWPVSKAAVSGIPYLFGGLDSVSLAFHLCIWEAVPCDWTPHAFVCPLPAFTWSCGTKYNAIQLNAHQIPFFLFSLSLGQWIVFLCITTKGIFFTLFSQKCLLSLQASGKLEANAFWNIIIWHRMPGQGFVQ